MEENKLGLPLEYSTLHKFYDALCVRDLEIKNEVLEALLKKHDVKTILDLTCGTGAQALWLAERGFTVTGADISLELLNIARDKAKQQNIDLPLLHGDMRAIQVGRFDAVITIFNAIGHLTKPDFEKAIQNIRDNLTDGGLYIFDNLNLNALTDAKLSDLYVDETIVVDETELHHLQYSEVDKTSGLFTSYDRYILKEGMKDTEILENTSSLQLYSAQELSEILARNGFTVLAHYSIQGTEFIDNITPDILIVAQKA